MSEGRSPVIRVKEDGYIYPHHGARVGPAWGYAWNEVFGRPEEVLRPDAVTAVVAHTGLAERTIHNLLLDATKAGLLTVTRRKRGRAKIPYLMRTDWYYAAHPELRPKAWSLPPEPWPEYAVRTEQVH